MGATTAQNDGVAESPVLRRLLSWERRSMVQPSKVHGFTRASLFACTREGLEMHKYARAITPRLAPATASNKKK